MAHTVATRMGRGGEPGKPRPKGVHKFVIEFAGGPLDDPNLEVEPEPIIDASRGKISYVFMTPLPDIKRWQCHFDLTTSGADPVDLRLFLRLGDKTASETWLYQFRPDTV